MQESAPPRESSLVSHNHMADDNDMDDVTMTFPFYILGQSSATCPQVLTPLVLEALRGFLPFAVSQDNFLLKFSLVRDGASLATLLHLIRASKYTIIGVETMDGDIFGSFTGTPWRKRKDWYGNGEAFLWRLKQSHLESANHDGHNEMEVYPYTCMDDQVQYCTENILAVGGGDWTGQECPYYGEPRGIGFMVDRHLADGETNSCSTFANPRLLCHCTKTSNEFHIKNLEVWTMTPCISLEEATKLELHKLFVEEQCAGRC